MAKIRAKVKTEYVQCFGSDMRSIRFLIFFLQKNHSGKNADHSPEAVPTALAYP